MSQALGKYMGAPGSGLETVIQTMFAVSDLVNKEKPLWIGFHLNMAIGHLSPPARQAYRERVEAFSLLVSGAFLDSQIRDGMSRRKAGELLWIALTGAQLLSDTLDKKDSAAHQQVNAWKAALRSIAPDEILPRLEQFVQATAEQYGTQPTTSPSDDSSAGQSPRPDSAFPSVSSGINVAAQSRAADTRRKLIDAAVDLFISKGYLETTPKEIAAAADLTTGAFYYHFSSKEALGVAIAEQGWPAVSNVFGTYLGTPVPGLENVTRAVFAATDIIFSDGLQWIGFFLDHASGHLSPSARQAHRERAESFTMQVPGAFRDSEVREDITRRESGELLWVAFTGSLLMSGALDEKGSAVFDRLAMAWNFALRSIVPAESLPRFEKFVTETAEQYGQPWDVTREGSYRAGAAPCGSPDG